ncbi:ABC transporter ATP-binding protein [Hugenholtzia roseola]|uniref:ABC transporter ATP-binding protein n=1 Tax=Hugenholtzia roseola TaxID=1002 RepID=UPI0004213FBA|nr:ABC transporter ATP-binding protein [Hugenholtzia roseola]
MAFLSVKNLSKSYTKGQYALQNVSFQTQKGEILALLGESGSGKTTLLRLLAGLETPNSGEILLADAVLSNEKLWVKPEMRGIGMVFQSYALFPHLNVWENVQFGVRNAVQKAYATQLLEKLGLSAFKKRYPHQLSGGQQQRVALARALAPSPRLLLLDEPFSNLDETLRREVRRELRIFLHQSEMSAIFVTHDLQDALAVADTLLILKEGKVAQFGKPDQIYQNPATPYVANFFGGINQTQAEGYFRPEDVKIYPLTAATELEEKATKNPFLAKILHKEYQGAFEKIWLQKENGEIFEAFYQAEAKLEVGEKVRFELKKTYQFSS